MCGKLRLLDEWTRQRGEISAAYTAELENVGDIQLLPVPAGSRPVWHIYPVRTSRADSLGAFLARRGIGTGRHYREPPHLSRAYAELHHRRGDFPVAERLADEWVFLPIFPGMSEGQAAAVTDSVREFFARGA